MPEFERHAYDVIVIGAGGAGLRAAIAAHDAGARTAVICKSLLGKAHTVMAEGGIAAAMGNLYPRGQLAGPLPRHHARRQAAQPLAHGRAARQGGARPGVGAGAVGRPVRPHPRRPDQPARLRRPPLRPPGPRRRPHRPGDDPHPAAADGEPRHRRVHGVHRSPACSRTAARIAGAFGYWRESGRFVVFEAPAVVLATGGIGKSWKVTSNSWEYTGDGHALALRAGATLVNMEFVQFHPTGMVWPPSVRGLLVTESVRGDGGVLRNSDGERFMFDYIPEFFKAETADTEAEGDRWYTDKVNNRRPAGAAAPRRGGPGHQQRDQGRAGLAARRGVPRHRQPAQPGVHPEAAAVDVPPVHGAGRGGHHQGAHGDRPDLPLRHGRRRGRPRQRGVDGPGPVRGRRGGRRHARRQPARRQLAERPAGVRPAGRRVRGRVRRRPGRRPARWSPTPTWTTAAAAALAPFDTEGGENPYSVHQALQDVMQDLVGIIRTESELKAALEEIADLRAKIARSRVEGHRQYNPGWHLALDLQQHAAGLRVGGPGRPRAHREPRRPHPRRLSR